MSMAIRCEPDAGYIAELIKNSRVYPEYTPPVAMALEYKYIARLPHLYIYTRRRISAIVVIDLAII